MRIVKIPQGISFEDFKKDYANAFPISNEKKREEAMQKEYDRLTGSVSVQPSNEPAQDDKPRIRKRKTDTTTESGEGESVEI